MIRGPNIPLPPSQGEDDFDQDFLEGASADAGGEREGDDGGAVFAANGGEVEEGHPDAAAAEAEEPFDETRLIGEIESDHPPAGAAPGADASKWAAIQLDHVLAGELRAALAPPRDDLVLAQGGTPKTGLGSPHRLRRRAAPRKRALEKPVTFPSGRRR